MEEERIISELEGLSMRMRHLIDIADRLIQGDFDDEEEEEEGTTDELEVELELNDVLEMIPRLRSQPGSPISSIDITSPTVRSPVIPRTPSTLELRHNGRLSRSRNPLEWYRWDDSGYDSGAETDVEVYENPCYPFTDFFDDEDDDDATVEFIVRV